MPLRLKTMGAQLADSAGRALSRRVLQHGWLQLPSGTEGDVTVKPIAYLPVYEELLGASRGRRITLLELGVWKGDSLAMWRDALPRARIVGVDLRPPDIDLGDRVVIVAGDQSDAEFLHRVAADHAPQGFDVIIDDAAHEGHLSAKSLQALYRQHLKPGGLYVIEDWGTGYLHDWPDGADPSGVVGADHLDESTPGEDRTNGGPGRMPSHDCGMVGLVKRLVDHTAAGTLGVHQPDWVADPLPIQWMRVQDGLVILKKRSGS
jgi:SAM-dependent methyltransferase